MFSWKTLVATAAALSFTVTVTAHADDDWTPLYVGQKSHIGFGAGFGFNFNDNGTAVGVQPYVAGRVRLDDTWGILVDVPAMYASFDGGAFGNISRFEMGNITLAAEYRLDELISSYSRIRFGVALPLVSPAGNGSLGQLKDVFGQVVNIGLAAGARGLFDLWRVMPDTFSLFGEFQGEAHFDEVYMDINAGLGLLMPTSDFSEFEMVMQLRARLGYGVNAIVFGGIGMVVIPTETGVKVGGNGGDGDAFQLGLQAGGIFKIGPARLDAWVQLNIDNPAGFSFSEEGVFGFHLAALVPL